MEMQLTPADKLKAALEEVKSGQWGDLFDEGEDLTENPVALYLLKNQHDTRLINMRSMAKVIEVLTGESSNPARFPWWQIEYKNMLLLRTTLQPEYTGATTNRVLAVVRGVLKEAWRLKLMSTDSYLRACSIENVAKDVQKRGRYISHEEMAALFKVCAADRRRFGVRDAAFLALLYATGLRLGEAQALALSDYDRSTGKLIVRKGKTGKRRVVYLTNESKTAFDRWMQIRGRRPGALLCPLGREKIMPGNTLAKSNLWRMLQVRSAQAGIKRFSTHDLRRSFITNLLSMGVDTLAVMKLAGHADIASTMIYDLREDESIQEVCELIHVPWQATAPTPPVAWPDRIRFNIGANGWIILELLDANGPMTLSESRYPDRRKLPAMLPFPPHAPGTRPPPRDADHYNRHTSMHRSLTLLERMELIRNLEASLHSGRKRSPYSGFEITPLGKAVFNVAGPMRADGKSVRWRPIKQKVMEYLEVQAAGWQPTRSEDDSSR